ncbi:hypothetical protein FJV76_17460 [Mesorhizobium sp. WSM4303]|nr:hypothetical protein FJV77_16745 [Mesorhizobium sp. WSM4306]TRD03122.1 hypothetical protein FJV76_17460 [Mesorhizobium sp. WSM4303]
MGRDMKTVVILTRRPGAATDGLARLHRAELLAAWAGIAAGSVRAIHGLLEGGGAVLEMETSTMDEVRSFVESLPYVDEALLDVRYCPLKPFVGFADLFAPA